MVDEEPQRLGGIVLSPERNNSETAEGKKASGFANICAARAFYWGVLNCTGRSVDGYGSFQYFVNVACVVFVFVGN